MPYDVQRGTFSVDETKREVDEILQRVQTRRGPNAPLSISLLQLRHHSSFASLVPTPSFTLILIYIPFSPYTQNYGIKHHKTLENKSFSFASYIYPIRRLPHMGEVIFVLYSALNINNVTSNPPLYTSSASSVAIPPCSTTSPTTMAEPHPS